LIFAEKFQKAQKAFEQALAIHEFMWGSQHPIVATSISCLARLKMQQKKYPEAKKYIDQALKLRELNPVKASPLLPVSSSVPGSELAPAEAIHWDPFMRGSSYEDLANYHEAVGELEEALVARKKHLDIISKLHIPSFATLYVDHPKIPFLKQAIKNLEERIVKKKELPLKVAKPKRTAASKATSPNPKASKTTKPKVPRKPKTEM
jgi:tetratricopeptide (TPR) repeat protein